MTQRTSIQIYYPTIERLKNVGRFGETYDGVINRLLDEQKHGEEKTNGE